MSQKKLWIAFALVVGISFAVLLYYGAQIYQQAPPVPEQVVDENGNLLFTGSDIKDGQNIWRKLSTSLTNGRRKITAARSTNYRSPRKCS